MGVDVCIRGGTVIDGTGGPARVADVGIVGDRVVAIEPKLDEPASTVIDADGRIVCPGFVDLPEKARDNFASVYGFIRGQMWGSN